MKLWLISRGGHIGYDAYDAAVVAAPSAEAARNIHPDGSQRWHEGGWVYAKGHDGQGRGWTSPNAVQVTEVGDAVPGVAEGVVCASFNAG